MIKDLELSDSVKETLIKAFEGYHRRLPNGDCTAYLDPGSDDGEPITIGFGTTEYKGPGLKKFGRSKVKMGDVLTRAESETEYELDIQKFVNGCNQRLEAAKVTLNQNQFDAYVSFSLNCGFPKQQDDRLKAGNLKGFADSMLLYVRGGNGEVLEGLVRRRNAEFKLWNTEVESGEPEDVSPNLAKYQPLALPWAVDFLPLQRGDQESDVFELNCALMGLGFLKKSELVSDVFTNETNMAVTKLQKAGGLMIDGIVGEKTKAEIERALAEARNGGKKDGELIADVKYYSQRDNRYEPWATCGLTSASILLSAYGINRTPDSLYLTFGKPQGQSPAGLASLYKNLGLRSTFSYSARLPQIKEAIRRGYPVVLHGYFTRSGHIVCAVGYNSEGLIVCDPAGAWNGKVGASYQSLPKDGKNRLYTYADLARAIDASGSIWASTAWRSNQDAIDLAGG